MLEKEPKNQISIWILIYVLWFHDWDLTSSSILSASFSYYLTNENCLSVCFPYLCIPLTNVAETLLLMHEFRIQRKRCKKGAQF